MSDIGSGVPRLLPGDTDGFLNRDDQIAQALEILDVGESASRPALIWLTGPAGIGKTTLAVRLGYLLADRFPDGQLYYELRGSTPGRPVAAADVLGYFLSKLGKSTDEIPSALEERAADFRSVTRDMRLLVVLDDAHTAGQVASLLPSSAESAVIVTSRARLSGLVYSGFTEVAVTEFSADLAGQLVAQLVDAERLAAEPDAARSLVGVCAGLPLALKVLGTRIAAKRRRSLATLVEQFTAAPFKHLMLDGDAPVEAVFDASYADLDPAHARAFCLLSLYPGPHFRLPTAAAMLGASVDETHDLLDGLVDAFLLQHYRDDAFRFHSLIGEYARNQAAAMDSAVTNAALGRMVVAHERRAYALGQMVSSRWTVGRLTGAVPPAYTGPDALELARGELDLDEPNFRAVVRVADELSMDEASAGICEALKPWYYDTDRQGALIEMLAVGVSAADRVGIPELAMRLHHDRGSAYEKAGELSLALTEFGRARQLARDPLGMASAVEAAGLVYRQLREHERAVTCYREAWTILDGAGDKPDQQERARVLLRLHLGTELTYLGRDEEAMGDLSSVRSWVADHGEQVNEGRALVALGTAHWHTNRLAGAVDLLGQAASRFAAAGFRSKQAETLVLLAQVELARGNPRPAVDQLQAARRLYERLGAWSRVAEVDNLLTTVEHPT